MRIRQRLLLGFLPASLLVISALELTSYFLVRVMLLERIRREMETVSDVQADRLSLAMRRNEDIMGLIASRVNMRRLLATRPVTMEAELTEILKSAKESLPDFLILCLTDREGLVLASTQAEKIGEPYRRQAWFPRERPRERILAMERSPDGRYRLIYVCPVEWEGQPVGWLVVHASPALAFSALGAREGAKTVVVTRDENLGPLWLNAPPIHGDYSARFPDPPDRPLFESLLANGNAPIPSGLRLGQTPVLGHSRVVRGTPWVLATLLDSRDALLPLRHLGRLYAILALSGLLMMAGVSLWTSRSLTLALRSLREEARHLRDHPHETHSGTENRGMREFLELGEELRGLTHHLSEIQQRLHNAVDHAANGMLAVDTAGKITLVNQTAARMTGYTQEALLGQSIQLLVPDSSRAVHQELIRDTFADRHTRPLGLGRDLELKRKDGGLIPVEIGLSPIESAGEALILVTLVDLTWRHSVEKEREQLVKDLEHRLKNNPGLRGMIHLCASCKKYHSKEDDAWIAIETYLASRFTDARFSHGICPDCLTKLYPEFAQRILDGEGRAIRNSGESGDPPPA